MNSFASAIRSGGASVFGFGLGALLAGNDISPSSALVTGGFMILVSIVWAACANAAKARKA